MQYQILSLKIAKTLAEEKVNYSAKEKKEEVSFEEL